MIRLTRLNNSSLTLNSDLIKFVEQNPDTVITLVNGEKLLVREPISEILKRVVEFRRRVLEESPKEIEASEPGPDNTKLSESQP